MFEQVKLEYGMDALEPVIDTLTVETHYGKHHANYTNTLNTLAEKAGVADMDIVELLGSLDKIEDETLRKGIRNNGGGYYNHNLYFAAFSPDGPRTPVGKLAERIDETFGSFDAFVEKMSTAAAGQFGSGWAFLSANKAGELMLSASPNQDNPISEGTDFIPILALDVWEHAYYLKYKNLRPAYIKEYWSIVDWNKVLANYEAIVG